MFEDKTTRDERVLKRNEITDEVESIKPKITILEWIGGIISSILTFIGVIIFASAYIVLALTMTALPIALGVWLALQILG